MVGQFFVFITWAKQLYHGAVPCITLIEILWSDLTLKQQNSQICHSAGIPVLLLSTLAHSDVALECLQSGKSRNFFA